MKPPLTPPLPPQRTSDLQLPDSNSISRASSSRPTKRKKPEPEEPTPIRPAPLVPKPKPRPEEMPPKPPFTYAQLIYKAIKGIGGKATLQEICAWVMNNFEYYQYAEPTWMSSVRHNLSSGRAFKKGDRCGGDRGKGFFWSLDEDFEQTFIDQETRAANESKKKQKLDQPPKRVVKNEPPPPLMTSTPRPLPVKSAAPPPAAPSQASASGSGSTPAAAPATGTMTVPMTQTTAVSGTTGVFAYNAHALTPQTGQRQPNPYSFMTAQPWTFPASSAQASGSATPTPAASAAPGTASTAPALSSSVTPRPVAQLASPPPPAAVPSPAPTASSSTTSKTTPSIPDVVIPIMLGPIPPSHPDHVPSAPYNSAKEGYMILHERALVLDPRIFGGLGKERLDELGRLGARRALGELTVVMVRVLKERREERRARKAGKRARAAGKEVAGAGKGPAVKAPAGKTGAAAGPAMPATIVMDPTPSGEDTIVVVDDDEGDVGAPAAKKARVA